MKTAQTAFGVLVVDPFMWGADWVWGILLIVLTVVIHILGLGLISERTRNILGMMPRRRSILTLVVVTGSATLLATCLHGMEVCIWALAYLIFGASADFNSSILYSLNAITSYGHTDLNLKDHWRLLGALEALNGWLLFGLTTAFLFAVMQTVGFTGREPLTQTRHPAPDASRRPGSDSRQLQEAP
jgi:hypothetical protein